MTLEFRRILDVRSIRVPAFSRVSCLECGVCQSRGPYTRKVLSAEPAAIKVPSGFHAIDRKLRI